MQPLILANPEGVVGQQVDSAPRSMNRQIFCQPHYVFIAVVIASNNRIPHTHITPRAYNFFKVMQNHCILYACQLSMLLRTHTFKVKQESVNSRDYLVYDGF